MELMKTAEEMVRYCEKEDTGFAFTKKASIRAAQEIEAALEKDEYVLIFFFGTHNPKSAIESEGERGYAITNKRLLLAMSGMLSHSFREYPLAEIHSVNVYEGKSWGSAIIECERETVKIGMPSGVAAIVKRDIEDVWEKIERKKKELISVEDEQSSDNLDRKLILDVEEIKEEYDRKVASGEVKSNEQYEKEKAFKKKNNKKVAIFVAKSLLIMAIGLSLTWLVMFWIADGISS